MIFLFSYFPILSQIASLRVLFGRGWWKKVSLTSSIGCEIVKGDISGHVVAREAAAFAVKSATEKALLVSNFLYDGPHHVCLILMMCRAECLPICNCCTMQCNRLRCAQA